MQLYLCSSSCSASQSSGIGSKTLCSTRMWRLSSRSVGNLAMHCWLVLASQPVPSCRVQFERDQVWEFFSAESAASTNFCRNQPFLLYLVKLKFVKKVWFYIAKVKWTCHYVLKMPDYILKLQKQTSNQILKYLVHVFIKCSICVFSNMLLPGLYVCT